MAVDHVSSEKETTTPVNIEIAVYSASDSDQCDPLLPKDTGIPYGQQFCRLGHRDCGLIHDTELVNETCRSCAALI